MVAAVSDGAGLAAFLVAVAGMLLAGRVVISASEGDPKVVEDGFVTRGGGWIDGKQVSWPFVELHVTPETIVLRPTSLRFFAPVTITRADRPTISTPWGPFGRGVRFSGATIGRRMTFWPARHGAVVEAMRQMSWPLGEPPEQAGSGVPLTAAFAGHRVGYRCSWVVWLQAPVVIGLGAVMILAGTLAVLLVPMFVFWGIALGTTAYRMECDGVTLTCVAPLWRRKIPVEDVVSIQGVPGGLITSGGKTTVTPRTGLRCWLIVATKQDRANLDWFLEQLETVAPAITIRR